MDTLKAKTKEELTDTTNRTKFKTDLNWFQWQIKRAIDKDSLKKMKCPNITF